MVGKLQFDKIDDKNFDDFVRLIALLAAYEKQQPPDAQALIRLKKDALAEHPKFEGYLVRLNQTTAGYLIFYLTYSSYLALPVFHIEDLFLDKPFRRRGYGTQIIEFCVRLATEKQCGRMEWTVYTWNKPAIAFYEKLMATRLDKVYYRLDKAHMDALLLREPL
jgi:GNAT superfamily N-acetyltransferase